MVMVGGELFVFSKTFSPEQATSALAPNRQMILGVHKIENIDPPDVYVTGEIYTTVHIVTQSIDVLICRRGNLRCFFS